MLHLQKKISFHGLGGAGLPDPLVSHRSAEVGGDLHEFSGEAVCERWGVVDAERRRLPRQDEHRLLHGRDARRGRAVRRSGAWRTTLSEVGLGSGVFTQAGRRQNF